MGNSGKRIMSKIAVVVPNWNGRKIILPCLKSLESQTQNSDVIVVDNGSTDGSAEIIRQNFPSVVLIELDKNYGFAGGVNAALRRVLNNNYQYVALLNNDAVADKEWVGQLKLALDKHPQVGIVASKILDAKGNKIDGTGDMYSIWGTPFPRGRGETDNGQYDAFDKRKVLAASGGACMYRVALLRKIGLFDERYFAYYEDVDISLRAQLAGWGVRYNPYAVVWHKGQATSGKIKDFQHYHMLKNYFYLYVKNMPGVLFWKYLITASIGFLGRTITLLGHGKFKIVFTALLAIVLNKPRLVWDRHNIQKYRKIGIAEFDSLLWHKPSPQQSKKIPFRWFIR